ncbi:hypothetical protein KQX54_004562 [Cotesia glomerata]|uniref:Uncharacterized protein n=1 Tax=Cotesia glomerata TaxID=32391 RepID=A0AAV7HR43_COTGL|nr:hypothetical protein KQX54_004562 [Cotesia glomerata]
MDAEPHVPISKKTDATFHSGVSDLTSAPPAGATSKLKLEFALICKKSLFARLRLLFKRKPTKCLNIFYRGPESDDTAGGGGLGFINIDASLLFKYFQKQQTILHLCTLLLLLLYIYNPSGYSEAQKKTT